MSDASTPVARSGGSRLSVDDWLEAGLDLLADEGLAAVKVEPLCTRLGVTKGSFYWHFEDLRSFLVALVDRWTIERGDARAHFDREIADEQPLDRLRWLMTGLVRPRQQSLERAIREWAVSDASVRARVAEFDRWLFDVILAAFRDLGFRGSDASLRAKTLYFTGVGYVHAARLDLPEAPADREALLELLSRKNV